MFRRGWTRGPMFAACWSNHNCSSRRPFMLRSKVSHSIDISKQNRGWTGFFSRHDVSKICTLSAFNWDLQSSCVKNVLWCYVPVISFEVVLHYFQHTFWPRWSSCGLVRPFCVQEIMWYFCTYGFTLSEIKPTWDFLSATLMDGSSSHNHFVLVYIGW